MQHPSAPAVLDPEVRQARAADGGPVAALWGAWDIRALESRARLLKSQLRQLADDPDRHWDLERIQRLDHIGALLIWQAWGKRRPPRLALAAGHEVFFANLDSASLAALGRASRVCWERELTPAHMWERHLALYDGAV